MSWVPALKHRHDLFASRPGWEAKGKQESAALLTDDRAEAMTFETKADCAEWCSAHPYPECVPVEVTQ